MRKPKAIAMNMENRALMEESLASSFSKSFDASQERMFMVEGWRDQYEGILPSKRNTWSSNVNVPLTKPALDGAVDQLTTTICNAKPMFQIEALDAADHNSHEHASIREKYLEYWIEKTRVRSVVEMAIKHSLIDGESWLYTGVKRKSKMPNDITGGINASMLPAIPDSKYVLFEDTCIMPYTAANFEQANGAFMRVYMRWNDIVNGGMDEDAVGVLEERWVSQHNQTNMQSNHAINTESADTIWETTFECWQGVYRWTEPESDVEKEWWVLAHYSADPGGVATILRAVEFRPLFGEHALWPFMPIRTNPIANSIHGRSMCEGIRGLQLFTNAMFNGCVDGVALSLLPPMLISGMSAQEMRQLEYKPMAKWRVSNPTDVHPAPPPGNLAAVNTGMGQLEFARQMSERETGVTDLMMGRPSQEKRTAFEMGAVVESGNQKFERIVARVEFGMDENSGLEAFAQGFMDIVDKITPDIPVSFKVQASGKMLTAQPDAKDMQFVYIAHGTNANVNPELRFKRSMGTIEQMKTCPFNQLSILDEDADLLRKVQSWYSAYQMLYSSMGIRNVEEIIGTEPTQIEDAIKLVSVFAPPDVAAGILQKYAPPEEGAGLPGMDQGAIPPGPQGQVGQGSGAGATGQPDAGGLPQLALAPGMA